MNSQFGGFDVGLVIVMNFYKFFRQLDILSVKIANCGDHIGILIAVYIDKMSEIGEFVLKLECVLVFFTINISWFFGR